MHRASLVVIMAALSACGGRSPVAPVELHTLRAAPSVATVDGQALRLETALWRDFQPWLAPATGRPLAGVLRIRPQAGGIVPRFLHATRVWVVLGEEIWSTTTLEERMRTSSLLEIVARDGPTWGPGIDVDVVVEVRGAHGEAHLVGARGQTIVRTD